MSVAVSARGRGHQIARVSGEFLVWWAVMTVAVSINASVWMGPDVIGWVFLGAMSSFVPAVVAMIAHHALNHYGVGQ